MTATPTTSTGPLSLARLGSAPPVGALLPGCNAPLERFLRLADVNRLYHGIKAQDPLVFVAQALDALDIKANVSATDVGRIPNDGSAVVVANHPYGILDGLLLAHLLGSVRRDLRILATRELAVFPELRDLLIMVDPSGQADHRAENMRGLRQALGWVREGGMLVVFPSGLISRPALVHGHHEVVDPQWRESVGRLIHHTGAPVVPVYVAGRNSTGYQIAGMLHPDLRLILQPRELLHHQGQRVSVRVGNRIGPSEVRDHADEGEIAGYLRFRTYLLAARDASLAPVGPAHDSQSGTRPCLPIASGLPTEAIAADIRALPSSQLLVESGAKQVFVAQAKQIPHVLHELGRLREITFRQAGEGTGTELDLDPYDQEYLHLFAWDTDDSEIIGAYRMGPTDRLLACFGPEGLYSASRFAVDPRLFESLGPALELGRSFVQPRYQRQYSSLLLLWKGIGQFVVRNPRYRKFFGMVSISDDYQQGSRQLMADVLAASLANDQLGPMVDPKHPLKRRRVRGADPSDVRHWGTDVAELNAWVADLEQDLKGVPVLVRQYVKMGATFLGFNVDPAFGNTLDGLIVVDLRSTPSHQLRRMFGAEAAKEIQCEEAPPAL